METMLTDGKAIEKLQILQAKEPTLFEKIKTAIAELIAKIKKAYKNVKPETLEGQIVASMLDEYETIQQMFVKALAGASENFKNAEVDTAQNTSSENKFSLRGINENGIEVYETSEDVLKLPWKERKTRYLDLMKNEFRGRTAKFERNGHYYYAEFDRKSLSKAVYGEKRSDKKGHDALVNIGADGDVFDLVENSRYTGSEVDKKNHPKADYFDYFVKTVQINNTVFDVLADVQKQYGKNGGYVYTIKLTENKSVKASPIREGQEASLKNSGNALTDETRIPQNGTDVNTSISENGVKYSDRNFVEDKYFSRQIDRFESLKQGGYVTVGKIAKESPLNMVGIPEGNLYFDVSKIVHEMAERNDPIPKDKMKEIPKVLDNPIVITEYVDNEGNHSANVYGEIFVGSSPVVIGVMIAKSRRGNIVSKIQTVHPNRNVLKEMVDDNILYLSENKKETKAYFQALGTHKLPFGGKRFGFIRTISQIPDVVKRSDRDPDALTPRNLLANALEESAVHEVEKKKLAEYKENIGKLYEKEQELYEVRKEIKELSFASGKRDTAKLKKLQDKAVKLSNSVT